MRDCNNMPLVLLVLDGVVCVPSRKIHVSTTLDILYTYVLYKNHA